MVIATSDSCNTLVSLENDIKQVNTNSSYSLGNDENGFVKTELYLPADDLDFGDDLAQQAVYLPVSGRVDEFLKHVPQIVEACDELLANPPRHFHQESRERVLYVSQGEVAHAVELQCDVILSDKATTCHILGFRSESDDSLPLTSLTHLDGKSYESCIRAMVNEHIAHHNSSSSFEEEKKMDNLLHCYRNNRLELQVHIVGGFEDQDSTSVETSNWLMNLLARIAQEEMDSIKMTLKTCAISSMNDNGYSCPIGRGLGIDLRTGEAFLAKTEEDVAGPATQIRSVRLWSGARELSLIHTSKSNDVHVKAFTYQPFPEVDQLLQLPDDIMLQYTSSSPDVEEPDFCGSVRSTLRFLRDVDCSFVFGPSVDQPLMFRRIGSSNSWERTR
jgi:hypothetical protein